MFGFLDYHIESFHTANVGVERKAEGKRGKGAYGGPRLLRTKAVSLKWKARGFAHVRALIVARGKLLAKAFILIKSGSIKITFGAVQPSKNMTFKT